MNPQFIAGPAGRLFISLYSVESNPTAEWVIHVPAFAEEMNKSRSMVYKQAVAFSEKGAVVVVPDLYGTGDSAGDFAGTSWELWKQDIRFLVSWAKYQGASKVTLWGLRSGALMALDLVHEGLDDVSHLILWQPVHSGEQMMTQFLRLRMAASMISGEQETVAILREGLQAGHMLEVAGYDVAPALLTQLDQVSLKHLKLPDRLKIDWLEVIANPTKPLLPVTQKLLALWQSQGLDVHSKTVVGEPFWTTQEVTLVPALIEATSPLITPSLTSGISLSELPVFRLPETDAVFAALNESVSPVTQNQPEQAFVFPCEGEELVGVLHRPDVPESSGVLIIVGGPQYRVGSHRQFVHLARHLASQNIPVMRFDYRGMGDASGVLLGFEHVKVDIRCAIDHFMRQMPELQNVVLWGLCDAASAACFYASEDERVSGLVLLNPWVRSEAGEAKAFLKHYYLQRLFSKQLWQKVIKGEFKFSASIASLLTMLKLSAGSTAVEANVADVAEVNKVTAAVSSTNLAEKIESSLKIFKGPVQFIISGNDLTAAEFDDAVEGSKSFTRLMKQKRFNRDDLKSADHTFSKREWKDAVANITIEWIQKL